MNFRHRYIHRQLLENRTQSFLSILSLTVAVALLCSFSTLALNTYDSITHSIIDTFGNYHVQFKTIHHEFIDTLDIHGAIEHYSLVQNKESYPFQPISNVEKNRLQVLGFSQQAFEDLQIDLISGRLPQNNQEIIVSDDALYHGKIKAELNQPLDLQVLDNQNLEKYQVVGIYEMPFFDMNSETYSFITTYDSNLNVFEDAYITFKDNVNVHQMAERFQTHFSDYFDEMIANTRFISFTNLIENNVLSNSMIGIFLIIILMFLGLNILLVRNSFKNSYANREKHLAILKTIGVTQRQCQRLILYEGILLLAIALVLGIIVGIGLTGLFTFSINWMLKKISVNSIQIGFDYMISCILLSSLFIMCIAYFSIKRSSYKIVYSPVSSTLQTSEEVVVQDHPYLELQSKKGSIFKKILFKNIRQNKILYRQIVMSLIIILSLFIFLNGSMGYLRDSRFFDVDEHNYDVVVTVKNKEYPTRLMTQLKQVENQKSKVIRESVIVDVENKNFTDEYLSFVLGEKVKKIQLIAYSDTALKAFVTQNRIANLNDFSRLTNIEEPLGILINQIYHSSQSRYYDIFEVPEILNLKVNNEIILDSLKIVETDRLMSGCTYVGLPQVIVSQKVFNQLTSHLENSNHLYEIFYQSSDPKTLTHELSMLVSNETVESYEVKNAVASFEKGKSTSMLVWVLCYGFIICLAIMGALATCCIATTNFEYRKQEFALYRVLGLRLKEIQLLILAEYSYYAVFILMTSIVVSTFLNIVVYQSFIADLGIKFFIPLQSLIGTLVSLIDLGILIIVYSTYKIKKMRLSHVLKNDISLL